VIETVIGGAPEALLERRVDLALTPRVPPGFSGASLMRLASCRPRIPIIPVPARAGAHAQGSAQAPPPDRGDTSVKRDKRGAFLEAEQRWNGRHMATSLQGRAYGFASPGTRKRRSARRSRPAN